MPELSLGDNNLPSSLSITILDKLGLIAGAECIADLKWKKKGWLLSWQIVVSAILY